MNSSHFPAYHRSYPQESSDQDILERTGDHRSRILGTLGKTDERNAMIKSAVSMQDKIDEEIRKRKEAEKIALREQQSKMMRYAVVVKSQNMQKILSFFQKEKSDLSFLDDSNITDFLHLSVRVYASNRTRYRKKEVEQDTYLRELYTIIKGEYNKRGMTSSVPDFPQKIETKTMKQKVMAGVHALSASR